MIISEVREKIIFIYLVELNDGKRWAFKNKKDAVHLMEKKLHMKQVKGSQYIWKVPRYANSAELITLELD